MPLLSRLLLLFCCFASHLALRLPHVSYAHLLQLGIACIRHAHVPCIRHARIPSAMHDASHEPHALPPSPTSRTHLSHARTSHAKVHQQRGLCGLDPNAASSTIVSSLGNLAPSLAEFLAGRSQYHRRQPSPSTRTTPTAVDNTIATERAAFTVHALLSRRDCPAAHMPVWPPKIPAGALDALAERALAFQRRSFLKMLPYDRALRQASSLESSDKANAVPEVVIERMKADIDDCADDMIARHTACLPSECKRAPGHLQMVALAIAAQRCLLHEGRTDPTGQGYLATSVLKTRSAVADALGVVAPPDGSEPYAVPVQLVPNKIALGLTGALWIPARRESMVRCLAHRVRVPELPRPLTNYTHRNASGAHDCLLRPHSAAPPVSRSRA